MSPLLLFLFADNLRFCAFIAGLFTDWLFVNYKKRIGYYWLINKIWKLHSRNKTSNRSIAIHIFSLYFYSVSPRILVVQYNQHLTSVSLQKHNCVSCAENSKLFFCWFCSFFCRRWTIYTKVSQIWSIKSSHFFLCNTRNYIFIVTKKQLLKRNWVFLCYAACQNFTISAINISIMCSIVVYI